MHFEETLTIARWGCRSVIGSQCVYSFSFDVASNPSNYSHSLLHIFYSNRMEFVCFALSKFIRWKWIRYDKKQNFPLPDDMTDQRSIKKTMLMDEIRIIAGRKCDQQWAEFCGIRYKSTEIMYINFHLLLMEPKEKKKPSTIWWTFLISLPSCAICLCSKQCALPKIRGLMFVCISWNEGGVWPMEKKKINKT